MNQLNQFNKVQSEPQHILNLTQRDDLEHWFYQYLPAVKYTFHSQQAKEYDGLQNQLSHAKEFIRIARNKYYDALAAETNLSLIDKRHMLDTVLRKHKRELSNAKALIVSANNTLASAQEAVVPIQSAISIIRTKFTATVSINSAYRFEAARINNKLDMLTA